MKDSDSQSASKPKRAKAQYLRPYFRDPGCVSCLPEIPASSKQVFSRVKDHIGENESGFPGIGLLALETGCDRATVSRSLQCLESVGLLTVERVEGCPNTYRIGPTYTMLETAYVSIEWRKGGRGERCRRYRRFLELAQAILNDPMVAGFKDLSAERAAARARLRRKRRRGSGITRKILGATHRKMRGATHRKMRGDPSQNARGPIAKCEPNVYPRNGDTRNSRTRMKEKSEPAVRERSFSSGKERQEGFGPQVLSGMLRDRLEDCNIPRSIRGRTRHLLAEIDTRLFQVGEVQADFEAEQANDWDITPYRESALAFAFDGLCDAAEQQSVASLGDLLDLKLWRSAFPFMRTLFGGVERRRLPAEHCDGHVDGNGRYLYKEDLDEDEQAAAPKSDVQERVRLLEARRRERVEQDKVEHAYEYARRQRALLGGVSA